MHHLTDRILFGAAYYHEYHSAPRIEEDFRLMADAGFTVVRVGESVWSTWEPENGVFNLEWLEPILDAAHHHNIDVVIGTPTYAVPMWLARQNPEINIERSTGHPMGWGGRQEANYAHPAYLFHAERIIRRIVERYASHPAVIGFQVDNEPGNEIVFNDQVFQRFVDHLRTTYGTVDAINEEWGLTYWSHRLSTWADVWRPDANLQPQYSLAWRKFQAQVTTDFISWQTAIVREYARHDQFITTCIAYVRPAQQEELLTEALDITAGNPYYRMQDRLALPDTHLPVPRDHHTLAGAWTLFAIGDRMFGSKQAPYLVTETNAQAIEMSWSNEPAWDGQYRQAAWALISRGATMIEYWHWHTTRAGAETYWGGILPHSLEPGRVYREIAQLGADLAAAGDRITELAPHSDISLLFSNESKWALNSFPALGTSTDPDRNSFETIYNAFARGTFDAGLQGHTVHPSQLFTTSPAAYAAQHSVLVAAGFTIADDASLRWLEEYAAAGGHLIVGIRTGYEDHEARARLERKPAFLTDASGVFYDEFSNLEPATTLPLSLGDKASELGFVLPEESAATLWVDGLRVTDADVLATYQHRHYGRFPAVTTRTHGSGRVTYIGTVPNPALAAAVLDWAVTQGGAPRAWAPQTNTQSVSTALNRHGETLHIIHNWSWDPSAFTVPSAASDVITGEILTVGASLSLGPWDVRVIAEASTGSAHE